MRDNCETASDSYEFVQNKQMAAQNRFEFASYLFILPKLWLSVLEFCDCLTYMNQRGVYIC